MAPSLSPRALAAMLRQMQQEKEERLHKAATDERKQLEREEEERKRGLEEIAAKKHHLAQKLKREQEDLQKLKDEAAHQVLRAEEEQRIEHLQRRIAEFRGNDDESLKERLMSEGFGEQLVTQLLQLRTLDEKLAHEGGLQARFSHKDPLDHIMLGKPNLYDMTDRRLLERVEGIRQGAAEKGYLSSQEESFLRTVEYHSQQFQQNDFYRDKDDRNYLTRTSETIDDIKKQLGLDWSTSTLTYGGKRL